MDEDLATRPDTSLGINQIVLALEREFGDRAINIAERQTSNADPITRAAWQLVLNALRAGPIDL